MRSHLAFARGDELVEQYLRAVGEVAELRFQTPAPSASANE